MPGTTKGQRTADELKAAALRVIARQGYLAAKITDITTEAGKAAGSFYRYFTDKDDLLRSIADDFATALRAAVTAHAGREHGMDTEHDVAVHVQSYWDTYREHLPAMTGIFEASLVSAEFSAQWERLRARHVAIWVAHLADAWHAAPREIEHTALAIVCLLERFCQVTLPTLAVDDDGRDAVDQLTRLIAHGILRPSGSSPDRATPL